jgi:ubiquinone/menaquinone biosynthesis C-methylase UbiE
MYLIINLIHLIFISCFFTLHHVENLDKLLNEITRILKPNGIFLIIEHNNYDDYENLRLDILHMLYGYLYDNRTDYITSPDFANYHNWLEWDYIISSKGLTYLKSNFLYTSLFNDTRYDNMYYAFYQKNN